MSLIFNEILGRKRLLEYFEKYPVSMCHCARLTGTYKNRKLISFLMNTCANFILKVLMVSQITFSYVKLLLQNKRGCSNIFLRFINNITLSLNIETNLIELGLVKTDSKISKTRSKIKLLTTLK